MKNLLIILFALCLFPFHTQAQKSVTERYAAGTVPVVDGFVRFDRTYSLQGQSRRQIAEIIKDFVQRELVDGPEQLPQARITEYDPEAGTVAASIEEYMYFKRTNWQIHRVRFYYQFVAQVQDGQAQIELRRLHYRYDPEVTAGDFDDDRRAEDWITDEHALTKNGTKLARISGKFRTFTIDRKDEIFDHLAKAFAGQK